jgi:hypothetical protein
MSLVAAQGAFFGEGVRDRAAQGEWRPVFLARTWLDLVNFYCVEQTIANPAYQSRYTHRL